MSFRVEFKRSSGTSAMFQRNVKFQIDITAAGSSANNSSSSRTTSTNGSSQNDRDHYQRQNSFRSVYCLTFSLISGPVHRFKRICENMQQQLLSHKMNFVVNQPQADYHYGNVNMANSDINNEMHSKIAPNISGNTSGGMQTIINNSNCNAISSSSCGNNNNNKTSINLERDLLETPTKKN